MRWLPAGRLGGFEDVTLTNSDLPFEKEFAGWNFALFNEEIQIGAIRGK
jgi:hypothetical protein